MLPATLGHCLLAGAELVLLSDLQAITNLQVSTWTLTLLACCFVASLPCHPSPGLCQSGQLCVAERLRLPVLNCLSLFVLTRPTLAFCILHHCWQVSLPFTFVIINVTQDTVMLVGCNTARSVLHGS